MSNQIDQRVVEMRFDNQHFEKNVATSLSTIEKLKQKLNFSGASKGFESINASAKKVDMSGLGAGIETVQAKFSALQVMGVTALANITNSAITAGKNMVSALTIQPVKTGFNEYELKMGSIRTIMASTGKDLETVNKYLNELNEYSDKTIYSFSDMTQNIGKFTNAGVELEDAVLAIKGISNEAAISGANTNEASRAMYNFAQALSAGYVKLIDWKSIELANMATVEFKEQLIATAVEMGTLTKTSDGMYRTLSGNTLSATKNFNETLSDQWMTSEVLIDTLKDYADETTEIGAKATKAATQIETFSKLMDTLKESAQSGWARTWELIFGDYYKGMNLWTKLGETIGGIIDMMSDARNKLLETVMNMGFDKLQKKISTALGPIKKVNDTVDKVTDSLEDLDKLVDDVILGKFGDGEERFEKLTKAGQNYYKIQNKVNEKLGDSHRYTKEQIEAQDKLLGSQEKTTEKTEKAEESVTKLTDAQKDQLKAMAKMTEEQAKTNGYTDEQIKALKDLKKTADKLGLPFEELIDNLDEINGRWIILNAFANIGETLKKVFTAVGDAFKKVFNGSYADNLFNIIVGFHKLTEEMIISDSTADKLQRTFQGIFAIVDIISRVLGGGLRVAFGVIKAVVEAFGGTVLDLTAGVGDLIYNFDQWLKRNDPIVKAIQWLADKLPPIVDKVKEFVKELYVDSGAAENFKRIADGMQSIWNVLHAKVSLSLNSVLKIIGSVFKLFGTNLGELLAKLADWVTMLVDWVATNTMLINGISKIAQIITLFVNGIARCIKAFMDLKPVQAVIEAVVSAFGKLANSLNFKVDGTGLESLYNWIEKIFKAIEKWITSLDESETFQAGMNIIQGVINGISAGTGKAIDSIANVAKSLIEKFCDLLGIQSPSVLFFGFGKNIIAGLMLGLKGGAKTVIGSITNLAMTIINVFKGLLGIHSPSTVFMVLGSFIIMGLAKGLKDGWGELISSVGGIASGIIDLFSGIIQNGLPAISEGITDAFTNWDFDFGSIAVIGIFVAMILVLSKLLKIVEKVISPFDKLGGLFGALSDSIKKMGKAKSFQMYTEGVLNLAKALALLSASILLISKLEPNEIAKGLLTMLGIAAILVALSATASIIKPEGMVKLSAFITSFSIAVLILAVVMKIMSKIDFDNAGAALGALVVMIAGMVAVLATFGALIRNEKTAAEIHKAGKLFTKMAVAMLIMAVAIKTMSGISNSDLKRSMLVIAGISVIFAGFVALSKFSRRANSVGSMMLKMAIAIALIPVAIKLLAGISDSDISKGLAVIAGIELMFAGVIAVSYFAGEHASKAGSMLLKMSFAIGILAMTMKLIATMSYDDITKGLYFIAGVEALFTAFIFIAQLADKGDKTGAMIFKMAAGMAIMALAIKIIASIPMGDIVKGLAVIAAVEVLFGAMVLLTNFTGANADKAGTMMLKMSLGILALSAAIALLSLLDPKKVAVGTAAILALMLGYAAIGVAVSKMQDCTKTLIILSVTLALLIGAVIGLTFIDKDKVATASAALSAIIGMLAILLVATKAAKKVSPTMLILVGVVGGLTLILKQLAAIPVDSAITNAIALSVLVLALSACLRIVSTIGKQAMSALIGVGLLTLMAVPLLAFVGILALMSGVNNAVKNATALAILVTAASLMLIPLAAIGAGPVAIAAALGVAVLTAMAVPLLLFVGILAVMSKVDKAEENALILTKLLITLTTVLAVLAVVGPMAMIGITALQSLIVFMGVIGALAIAIGVLLEEFPQIEEFLDRGIPVLEKLARAVGSLIGNLVAGFAASATSGLPEIGTNLSKFMENAQPFINGAKSVDGAVLKGVGILGGAILALVAADFIENMASFMQLGSDFSSLGAQLSVFAIGAMPFINIMKSIKPETAEGIKSFATAILAITAADFLDGIKNFLGIDSSLSEFCEQFGDVGEAIKTLSGELADLTEEDIGRVKLAAEAIKTLINAGSEINGQSDLGKSIFGDNSLSTFVSSLPVIGVGLTAFVNSLGDFGKAQVATIKSAAEAITTMVGAGSDIDGQSGFGKWLTGDNSLATYASDLPVVGLALRLFSSMLGDFGEDDVASVKAAADAIGIMISAGDGIDAQSGWSKFWTGDDSIAVFTAALPGIGSDLNSFITNLGSFGEGSLSTVNSVIGVIKAFTGLGQIDISTVSTTLGSFGDNMVIFADDLVSFIGKIADLNVGTAETSLNETIAVIENAASKISNNKVNFRKAGEDIMLALNSGIKFKKQVVVTTCTGIAGELSKAVKSKNADTKTAGTNLITQFINGVNSKKKAATTAINTMITNIVDAITSEKNEEKFTKAGKDLGEGFILGIEAKETDAYWAGYDLGAKAAQGVKDGEYSNSPSKKGIRAGKDLGLGLIIGIKSMGDQVYGTGYDLGNTGVKSMRSAISKIMDLVDADIDTNPTIRPVLDLSDVESGAASLNGMFGGQTLTVDANSIGVIPSAMSRLQNGSNNSDIISAIRGLGKDLSNTSGDTYNINGITYDDGSNITSAVKTLVRAARIEGRV